MSDNSRPDPWVQTLDGGAVDLVNPTPDQINFSVIARVLGGVPRFGRHTFGGPYSVAQHCVEGALAIERDMGCSDAVLAFLLHDAHEAYIGDDPTPKLSALEILLDDPVDAFKFRIAYRTLKARLDLAIHTAAGVPWPLPDDVARIVKDYDLRMCRAERDVRMESPPKPWHSSIETAAPINNLNLITWSESVASDAWMRTLLRYRPEIMERRS